MMRQLYVLSLIVVLGCKGTGGGSNGDDTSGDDQPAIDAPIVIPDAPPPPPGYTRLIGRTWSLPAGQADTYKCARFTVPQDMYITNILAQAPTGTHHTVLSLVGGMAPPGPDGEQDCSVSTLGMVMLYASGVGTSPLDFPNGVGIKIKAGQQIHLNLHLFNASDKSIAGDSAILVKSQPTPPPTLAEMVFAGTYLISIASDNQPHTVGGGCTSNRDYTLFAVWPHMHQTATHQKITLTHAGTPTVLHDMPYSFNEQKYWLQNPLVQVKNGDTIRVDCTYVNNTGHPVKFGDSSNDEMCFGGLYRYPAANNGLFDCVGL